MTDPVLDIRELDIALTRGGQVVRPLITGGRLRVAPGTIHALVGESGSGKTLMARSIIGLIPSSIAVTGGSIRFKGKELVGLPLPEMQGLRGRRIGYVFQEPMLSLNPALRIGIQMAEGLRHHLKLSRDEIRERSLQMLRRVSLRDPEGALDAYPHEFSGGMRQRIMLASVMALRPSLLIADEPTTALDAVIQREVLDIMTELTTDMGTSVLLITHDLGLVAQYAGEVSVMQKGLMVEAGTAEEVITHPRAAYTRKLLEASPVRRPRPGPAPGAAPVLQVRGLQVRYPGRSASFFRRATDFVAVRHADLEIRRGETVAVVGESGSGKTTIGRAILGLRRASGGEVVVAGRELEAGSKAALRRVRRRAQIIFQDPGSSLDPRLRVGELVGEGLRLIPGLGRADREARIAKTLADVGLDADFVARFPHELSGGQRQRIAIARALILEPELIVADEAVSALDVTVQAQILDLLDRLQREHGFGMMFITHDLGVVEQIADRVIVMRAGRVLETAPRDPLFDAPLHPYTRRLLAASTHVEREEDGSFRVRRAEDILSAAPARDLPWYEEGEDYELTEADPGHFVALQASAAMRMAG
ncbi:dipeptide ABC transporter ATP-binding protein [Aureimonas populi]|uniref:Dipeptide ABC transporter ATP-binding protein n=1 Tax=Aureimonas populi TaxID=1701758 RepID=A0ABW5CLS4_9HYPH|nr:ABC transporter ATP-binding protein [Aureimonas populi]